MYEHHWWLVPAVQAERTTNRRALCYDVATRIYQLITAWCVSIINLIQRVSSCSLFLTTAPQSGESGELVVIRAFVTSAPIALIASSVTYVLGSIVMKVLTDENYLTCQIISSHFFDKFHICPVLISFWHFLYTEPETSFVWLFLLILNFGSSPYSFCNFYI